MFTYIYVKFGTGFQFLQKNEIPLELIDKSDPQKYLRSNVHKQENEQMPLLESSNKRFYKLPQIPNFCKKKRNLTTYYKPNTNIELVFSSSKISSLFSMKDRV